jgi:hypothetical protein
MQQQLHLRLVNHPVRQKYEIMLPEHIYVFYAGKMKKNEIPLKKAVIMYYYIEECVFLRAQQILIAAACTPGHLWQI